METQTFSMDAGYGYPPQRIKVFVNIDIDRKITDNEDYEISKKIQEIQKMLRENTVLATESFQQGRIKEKENLLKCFGDRGSIFVQEIPNEYHSNDDKCVYPWFIVTTPKGHIKIGWRKRVINIDWSNFEIKVKGHEIFPKHEGTIGDYYIHANSYDYATQVINKLLTS